ncbi:hypothetical protein [Schlesneria paludicola]|uniref:hypothetical protein n=1 Tax=Schlesneria paludicola TaxID=360056 RepID=UPI0002DA143A|nr:hypothetical protein [Schlesneria paludicola]
MVGQSIIGLMFQQSGSAVGCLASSWVLASASFGITSIYIDEAGTTAPVVGFGPGFWIWYLSIVTGFLSAIVLFFVPRKLPTEAISLTEGDFLR